MTRQYTEQFEDDEDRLIYPDDLYRAIQRRLTGTGDTIEDALYDSGYHLDEFDDEHIQSIRCELERHFDFEFDKEQELWLHNGDRKSKVRLPVPR